MAWLKKHGLTLFLVIVLAVGLGLVAYPSISNWWNSQFQTKAIRNYNSNVAKLSDDEYEKIISDAEQYNEELAQTGIKWTMTDAEKEEYNRELSIDESGIMGYINIPKINVYLPIYHGTSTEVLKTSIGHLEGTSLPVGGKTSHCVLSGHRGLPSATLFSNLDKLVEGDTFTLTILNETLTYQVDQIRIVLPDDISSIQLEEGKDYCTLLTCTPYGVNTHRLLVRGHRIANASGDAKVIAEAIQIDPMYVIPCIAIPVLIVLFIVLMIRTGKRYREKRIGLGRKYLEKMGLDLPVDSPKTNMGRGSPQKSKRKTKHSARDR